MARALGACALAAAALATLVTVSGGFRADIGFARLSIRSPWPAAGVAAASLLIAFLLARTSLRELGSSLRHALHRYAAAVALLASAATLAVGLLQGSVVPSGADASGYLSQAALWRRGELHLREPSIAEAPWPNAAWTFAPLGYRPSPDGSALVPTYPPGLPLHFAAFGAAAGEWGIRLVVPLLGAAAIWCTFVIGRRVSTAFAGATAAILLATSPPWLHQLMQPMSDVPVTAWWLVALVLASWPSRSATWRGVAAGLAAFVALLVRPNLVLVLAGPAFVVARGAAPGERTRALAAFAAGVAPALLALAALNAALYGAPWISGYGSAGELFSPAFVSQNLRLYGSWLADVHLPLVATAFVGLTVIAIRSAQRGADPLATGLAITAAAVLASYLAYAPFETWAYLRFLLPLVAVLGLSAAVAVDVVARLRGTLWPALAVLAVVALAGVSWDRARDLGVFSTKELERRYAAVAYWIDQRAPADILLLSVQHSGSLRAITGRPVLRWDMLDDGRSQAAAAHAPSPGGGLPWLDLAWTGRHRAGRQPPAAGWLVVEADEEPAFRRRFASVSELGRLDWPPSAATDPPASVRVYRLEDRERYLSGARVVTERIAR